MGDDLDWNPPKFSFATRWHTG